MTITISETAVVAAVERHIRIAARNKEGLCFTEIFNYDTNIAAASAILTLAEKEAGIKVRKSQSITGLNKRLGYLIA